MSSVGPEGRSFETIDTSDLNRLAAIALEDLGEYFRLHPDWGALYRDRLLAVTLCQGAASHFIDGTRGVNDFDVFAFFAAHPARAWYAKRRKLWDFGDPKFGTSIDHPNWVGRRVDLMGRGITHRGEDPAASISRWLESGTSKSSRLLARAPVVLLYPYDRIGEVVWRPPSRHRVFS